MNSNSRVTHEIAKYEPIDISRLATALAEDAWEEEVRIKKLTKDDLYETIVSPGGGTSVQIKSEWAYDFFAVREKYLNLINEYKLPEDF